MAFSRAHCYYYGSILLLLLYFGATLVQSGAPVRPGTGNPSPRLPRTSASQLSAQNGNTTGTRNLTAKNLTTQQTRGNYRSSRRHDSNAAAHRTGCIQSNLCDINHDNCRVLQTL
ncbi:hypothetical protein pipiens_005290 [Culex pipiens pipiens]|uniref:Uncharacterized protein n=1 Tax=Culex pipiens pipiens TaxID=38569 RepID=A0ABD1DYT8_CULPP